MLPVSSKKKVIFDFILVNRTFSQFINFQKLYKYKVQLTQTQYEAIWKSDDDCFSCFLLFFKFKSEFFNFTSTNTWHGHFRLHRLSALLTTESFLFVCFFHYFI